MSQDDETVERVARAIAAQWAIGDKDLATFTPRALARAALSALPPRDELLREALSALDRIVDFHIGDCPMTMEEIDFAKNINWQIRKTARAAADKIRAALTQEPQP